jgi:copper transport protein
MPLMKSLQRASAVSMNTLSSKRRGHARRVAVAVLLALFLMLLFGGVASAHATLAKSDPASGAILDADQAPTQVRLWFTEDVNPALTKASVVDHNNKEVDLQNSRVSPSDPREVDVGLHQLQPDFYVVIWKSVSAEDGHATGGSFYFRVRYPDGTVPNLPSELPTGPANFANSNSGQCLAGSTPLLCAPEVLSDWLVFLAAITWVGGMFWQTFIVERAAQAGQSLVATALATARRFRRIAVVALTVFLVANITFVVGQAMLAGGDLGSGFSPAIWDGILLHSSFGIFWLLRELLALCGLLWLVALPERPITEANWRPRPMLNWSRIALGLLLLMAMAFSGHAAAAQARGGLGAFAVPVDWLHLLSTSLWVGGIIFIAITLMPAIWSDEARDRAQALVSLLPRFSVIALSGFVIASLSGSFNADVQLTSWSQFIDTTYGRALMVKILLVLTMMMISAYHAFRIRPALSKALGASELGSAPLPAIAGAEVDEPLDELSGGPESQQADKAAEASTEVLPASKQPQAPSLVEQLSEKLRLWIQREAMLGVSVLFCASLLGGLAGSLAPQIPNTPNINAPTLTSTTKTPVDLTQTVDGLKVTLKVAPDKFGTNSVGVLVIDTKTGKPVDGANVHLLVNMVEMDMGTGTSDLKESDNDIGTGFYTGQVDLLMSGHWNVQVQIRTPADPTTIHRTTFTFAVAF